MAARRQLYTPITTPNGTTRHIDVSSVDDYLFAGAHSTAPQSAQWGAGVLWNNSTHVTVDQTARGSNYGSLIDAERHDYRRYDAHLRLHRRRWTLYPGYNRRELHHPAGAELGDLVLTHPWRARGHLLQSHVRLSRSRIFFREHGSPPTTRRFSRDRPFRCTPK